MYQLSAILCMTIVFFMGDDDHNASWSVSTILLWGNYIVL
jgi:hypothetical protein